MDFGMPYAQKQAWNNVKKAIDNYVELTGSDIAVVTEFNRASQLPGSGDDHLPTKRSLALHGHGNLLLQVKQYLEQIQLSAQGNKENGAPTQIAIPAPQRNVNYHNQSIARSLTSSFQSLKLDSSSHGWKSHTESQKKEKLSRRNPTTLPKNRDLAELDENLLFEEESPDEECRDSSDSDLDNDASDFDSDDSSDMRRDNAIIRPRANEYSQPDPSKSGTSLPVNINMNYMKRTDARPHFARMTYQNMPTTRAGNFTEDTPNPAKMMASIQALARSVTEDSAQIFGDRPRPHVINQKFT